MTNRLRRAHTLEAGAFLVLAAGFMIFLARHPHHRSAQAFSSSNELFRLRSRYQTDGMEGYLQEKDALRDRIENTLKEGKDSDSTTKATRVAVYLFPEILPDNNFEKPMAYELWSPLEAEIERAPGTQKSRNSFEELRANIWNYESPNRSAPELSEDAEEVIKIYDALSQR